jgi:hypothetical protein
VSNQGEFNIFSVIDGSGFRQAGAGSASNGRDAPALTWSLGEFVLSDGLVRWRDESNRVPVVGEVRQLQVQVGAIDSRLQAPIEIAEVAYQVDLGERFRVPDAGQGECGSIWRRIAWILPKWPTPGPASACCAMPRAPLNGSVRRS